MIEIQHLGWDSDFFNFKIGKVDIDALSKEEIAKVKEEQYKQNYDLLYLMTIDKRRASNLEDAITGVVLMDEKVTFSKKINKETVYVNNRNISEYKGCACSELLELVYLSGHESRFKKDAELAPYFEKMYKTWIDNSISGQLADTVLVHGNNQNINGFVSLKKEELTGNIGLIATAKKQHGKGIGRQLMHAAENWYMRNKITKATVVTQLSNTHACSFYKKNGYSIKEIQYIYHLWNK
ncbi:GNAT family N-acetyltransferase [Carboxylicivirga sp. RSCT41]|uniref:GNAT family N-acetyltransferase n=1 Tax=Carboxylicivirga agarovorans TaxID=3417570 RepID=UPI003D358046